MVKTPVDIAVTLLIVATVGLASPLLAASAGCDENAVLDCCGLDGSTCLCCWRGPQISLSEPRHSSGGGPDGRLRPDERAVPRDPLPRDILHVPRFAPLR